MPGAFRDNAARILPVTIDLSRTDRDAQFLAVARSVVPDWANARHAEVSVVDGGITNLLFLLRSGQRCPLLVRVYGDNTEVVIDREAENALFAQLSCQGFSPAYWGRFANGRIEGWCEGYCALEPADLGRPHFRRLIAARLRELHALPPPTRESRLWSTLGGWMETARTLAFEGRDGQRHQALDVGRYASLLQDLPGRVAGVRTSSWGSEQAFRLVLAHNDLLAGNILTNQEQDRVIFIDYEYGATSVAAFDVANHFCEYAGFDSDFASGFPARDARDDFIAHYLGARETTQDVSDFSSAVEALVLADHLWWGTWAVIQACYSPIDFDYLDYARLRFAGFDLHHPVFLG